MEKNSEAQVSSPVATVEEIQKRLLRPSLQSQPSSSFVTSQRGEDTISQVSSQYADESSYEMLLQNKREMTKVPRLEDYLDPVVLSAIRAKIRRNNYRAEIKKKTKIEVYEFDQFEWPGDHHSELKALIEGTRRTETVEDRNDVVDLDIH